MNISDKSTPLFTLKASEVPRPKLIKTHEDLVFTAEAKLTPTKRLGDEIQFCDKPIKKLFETNTNDVLDVLIGPIPEINESFLAYVLSDNKVYLHGDPFGSTQQIKCESAIAPSDAIRMTYANTGSDVIMFVASGKSVYSCSIADSFKTSTMVLTAFSLPQDAPLVVVDICAVQTNFILLLCLDVNNSLTVVAFDFEFNPMSSTPLTLPVQQSGSKYRIVSLGVNQFLVSTGQQVYCCTSTLKRSAVKFGLQSELILDTPGWDMVQSSTELLAFTNNNQLLLVQFESSNFIFARFLLNQDECYNSIAVSQPIQRDDSFELLVFGLLSDEDNQQYVSSMTVSPADFEMGTFIRKTGENTFELVLDDVHRQFPLTDSDVEFQNSQFPAYQDDMQGFNAQMDELSFHQPPPPPTVNYEAVVELVTEKVSDLVSQSVVQVVGNAVSNSTCQFMDQVTSIDEKLKALSTDMNVFSASLSTSQQQGPNTPRAGSSTPTESPIFYIFAPKGCPEYKQCATKIRDLEKELVYVAKSYPNPYHTQAEVLVEAIEQGNAASVYSHLLNIPDVTDKISILKEILLIKYSDQGGYADFFEELREEQVPEYSERFINLLHEFFSMCPVQELDFFAPFAKEAVFNYCLSRTAKEPVVKLVSVMENCTQKTIVNTIKSMGGLQ
ncbi:hypothetical protein RCL1_006563 [Eukaryota sp. TZLM3-RCL]